MRGTVLYVNSSAHLFGGAETCLLDMATGIAEHAWHPAVALPSDGKLADVLRAANVHVTTTQLGVFSSRQELRSPRAVIRLAQVAPATVRLCALARSLRVSIVHSNTSVVLAGALAARLVGRPHIWHIREILRGPAWSLLRRLIFALSDRVVCISSAVANNLAPMGSRASKKVVLVADGIDLHHFQLPRGLEPTSEPRIAMVARINPWKGHELFLRAASVVATQMPNARFYIAGACVAEYQALQKRLVVLKSELGLDGKIEFLGHLDRRSVRDLMASVTVLVLPSVQPEPGGLALLEAMALQRPVVATAHGGPIDIVEDGVNGFLVEPNDPHEMAAVILRLASDRALRESVGSAARRRVETAYGLQDQLCRLSKLYGEVLEEHETKR